MDYDVKQERLAKAAGTGEMLNIHDLKVAYEKAIGHATSDSTIYNLLHRHGWRKLTPRPFPSLPGRTSCWFSTAPPTTAAATLPYAELEMETSCVSTSGVNSPSNFHRQRR